MISILDDLFPHAEDFDESPDPHLIVAKAALPDGKRRMPGQHRIQQALDGKRLVVERVEAEVRERPAWMADPALLPRKPPVRSCR